MAFGAFERMVAARYIRARRAERVVSVITAISFLGIGLGVATLIVVMAVMNGFRQDLLGRILGMNGHISVQAAEGALAGFDPVAVRLRELPGVTRVTPLVEGHVMATHHAQSAGAQVRGIRRDDLLSRMVVVNGQRMGSLYDFGGEQLVMGSRLAQALGVAPGDTVTLVAPEIGPEGRLMPRRRGFVLAGTFHVNMYEYDNTVIFMPLDAAQVFFRLPEAVTRLDVETPDPEQVAAVVPRVRQAVPESLRVEDWRQVNRSVYTALQVERVAMFLILTLIILVAALNIVSSLVMLVKDKARGIAVLRTLGATRGMVLRVFFLAGAGVGVTGTVLGVALGLAFALNIAALGDLLERLAGANAYAPEIQFLANLPARVEAAEVVAVVLMALFLSFAATFYPAWKAARMDPVEALRYE